MFETILVSGQPREGHEMLFSFRAHAAHKNTHECAFKYFALIYSGCVVVTITEWTVCLSVCLSKYRSVCGPEPTCAVTEAGLLIYALSEDHLSKACFSFSACVSSFPRLTLSPGTVRDSPIL